MIKFLAIIALIGVAVADPTPTPLLRSVPDGRIIGGKNTSIEEVPYQASIMVSGRHYCGGSIIAKNWVLTAAHCADHRISSYSIRTGSSKTNIGGSIHKVSRIISHENYFTDRNAVPSNDVALFKVAKAFEMGTTRQAIELFKNGEETPVGMYSVITGWGTISPNTTILPRVLQIVSVPIISKNDCKRAYAFLTHLNPGQICAAYPNGGKDACQGDSGGPLVVEERLAGVVSWGNGCAVARQPGVYTEVAYFRQWIDETMKKWNGSSSFHATTTLGTTTLVIIAHMALACGFLSY